MKIALFALLSILSTDVFAKPHLREPHSILAAENGQIIYVDKHIFEKGTQAYKVYMGYPGNLHEEKIVDIKQSPNDRLTIISLRYGSQIRIDPIRHAISYFTTPSLFTTSQQENIPLKYYPPRETNLIFFKISANTPEAKANVHVPEKDIDHFLKNPATGEDIVVEGYTFYNLKFEVLIGKNGILKQIPIVGVKQANNIVTIELADGRKLSLNSKYKIYDSGQVQELESRDLVANDLLEAGYDLTRVITKKSISCSLLF